MKRRKELLIGRILNTEDFIADQIKHGELARLINENPGYDSNNNIVEKVYELYEELLKNKTEKEQILKETLKKNNTLIEELRKEINNLKEKSQ